MWIIPWPVHYLIVAVMTHPLLRPTTSSVPFCLPTCTKMLPFPVFLLLIFSATLLAPAPAVLVGFIRTLAIQSSEWNTLPVAMPSHASETPSLPVLLPQVSLDALSTCRGPSPISLTYNNTIPPSHVYRTDDRTTSTAVLSVIVLAMVNCLVRASLYLVFLC
jgi:hypothetical protein